jgi:putative protease
MEAGADAIYVGLTHFSARAYAENFTLGELKGMIDESRRNGVKSYLAFNSLIKETELADAYRALMAVSEMAPDAIIVQDLGLAAIRAEYAQGIPIHASTLTAVHTLDGLSSLADLGFSRAVLPRELNLSEISLLAKKSPIGVEVFVHGALCFSFSGLCLMSSFLGGRSALRGGCTQPCRRYYLNAGRKRNFFSLSDLMGLAFVPELRKLPIAALKIEGRMKGPDYVGQAVKAYRLMLDSPEDHLDECYNEALEILRQIPSRQTCQGFFPGDQFAPGLWATQNASGVKLGYLTPVSKGLGKVTLAASLKLMDRLRFSDETDESQSFKVRKIYKDEEETLSAEAGETVTLAMGDPDQAPQPSMLYKIGSGSLEKELMASEPVKRIKSVAKGYSPRPIPSPHGISPGGWAHPSGSLGKSNPLWVWLKGFDFIQEILKFNPRKIIMPVTPENVKTFSQYRRLLSSYPHLVWSLPALIFGRSQEKLKKEAKKLIEFGQRDFMIPNIGHARLLSRLHLSLKLWGDYRLGVLNHLSAKALQGHGLAGVTLSPEIDQLTLEKMSRASFPCGVLLYLFGRPALFTARFRPPNLKRGPVVSQRNEKFFFSEDNDSFILQSDRRVYVGGLLKAPKPSGYRGMIVDIRWEPNPVEAFRRVKKAVDQGRDNLGMSFNFKRGLQ